MRRSILCSAAALALAAFVGGEAQAQDKVEWNFSVWGGPRAFTVGIETLAEYVKEKSGGNFTITIHYGESVAPAREKLDAVSLGAVEGAFISPSYHPAKLPLHGVLDLPFLPIPDLMAQQNVREAFYEQDFAKEELGRWDAVVLFNNFLPNYEFMGRGQPPRAVEDWRGMRVRALGGHGDAMRTLGAVPTTVTAPETYQALERGVVQAIGFPFSYAFGAYRLHEVATWYTYGIGIGAIHNMHIFNTKDYEALPAEYRQMLQDGKWVAYEAMHKGYRESDEHWIPIFEANPRLERIDFSPEEAANLREAGGEPVWNKWAEDMEGRGLPGRKVLEFVLETAEAHSGS